MNLHEFENDFNALSGIVAERLHINVQDVKRDYFIVYLLEKLAQSEWADKCVFKGGTSLSKCYPKSIERFSEDIDLTYLGMEEDDRTCDKAIRKIIAVMTDGAHSEKIPGEGNARNKSRKVWFDSQLTYIKLEVGSSVRPEPYAPKTIKSYIHEYLDEVGNAATVERFDLRSATINTLAIERTFVDKVMAVKRHAICGTLGRKVRHIYDVVMLCKLPEIQSFLSDNGQLKYILRLTKNTDSHYLEKRNIPEKYNPLGAFDFESWRSCFNDNVRRIYEKLHVDLLYTNEPQNFDDAIKCFEKLDNIFKGIGE